METLVKDILDTPSILTVNILPVAPELIPSDIEFHLLPGEHVINFETPPIVEPFRLPSALRCIMKLTGVNKPRDIGLNGSSMASTVTELNEGLDELRLFEAKFGRDEQYIDQDLIEQFPNLAWATVLELATHQGVKFNPASEEEPGRIFHELRDPDTDQIAKQLTAERGWEWPYYGSVDATPMFVSNVVKVLHEFGDDVLDDTYIDRGGNVASLGDAFDRSVGWILNRMAQNPEGLVEFRSSNPNGIENQVWKDSLDSYFHHDGRLANHEQGIASIEVQVLAHEALLDAVDVNERTGRHDSPYIDTLKQAAHHLKSQIDTFWVEDERGGYFVLGKDRDEKGQQRNLEIRTSNMGHVLDSRLLEGDEPEIVRRREALIATLFSEEMLATAGIRTLSSREYRYRPGAYHNGSVWPSDCYKIAKGLERHGYFGLAFELRKRIWETVNQTKKLPEYVRGENGPVIKLNKHIIDIWDEVLQKSMRIEQPPQELHGWTASAKLASAYKYQPLRPEKGAPVVAIDSRKRAIEKFIADKIAA